MRFEYFLTFFFEQKRKVQIIRKTKIESQLDLYPNSAKRYSKARRGSNERKRFLRRRGTLLLRNPQPLASPKGDAFFSLERTLRGATASIPSA